ncbi:hypothetical protein HYDPIDRAFT_113827 [Hydnomerulius pinastri MD-312]|uniref:RING-type E3 ubiquitin transferase n=1 Tax=Hydnomerulius pinastri MD-312 TaxID=994086 RepID=A0A0C9WDP4_9AGAM|nr:hypothetical protein HYDPIDRAFT_113827 [Hydnomerulius pinastri MD-312]
MTTCRLCPGRSFADDNAVRMHKEAIHWCCETCDAAFRKEEDLEQHNVAKHPPEFSCDTCGKILRSQQGLDQHCADKHAPEFECRPCGREFSSEESLEQHNAAKHPPEFSCDTCGKVLRSQQGLDQHCADKHTPAFECRPCGREFSSEESLEQHNAAKHPPEFPCDTCGEVLSSQHGLDQHCVDEHPPMFECQDCDREFPKEESLQQHRAAKHPDYPCYTCGTLFSSQQALEQHRTDKHPPLFECQYCDREFKTIEGKQQHETVKHPSFECSHCDKAFSSRNAMVAHAASHRSYSPYGRSSQTSPYSTVSTSISTFPSSPVLEPAHAANTSGQESTPSTLLPLSGDETDQTMVVREEYYAPGSEGSCPSEKNTVSNDDPSTTAREDVSSICECTVCERAGRPCSCTVCKRRPASPFTSAYGDIQPDDAQDDRQSTVSDGAETQNCPADDLQVTYHCLSCSLVFDTDGDLQGHVCTSCRTIFRPHCSFCYTQFDDETSLEQHMDNSRVAFSCHVCQTPCCSDDMLQEHVLTHPTCLRCESSFIDDLDLCKHVELAHPVVVCWDCEGAVVDQGSLELHYADSPEHPSCSFCEVGMRNSEDMADHLNTQHATESALNEMEGSIDGHDQTAGGQVTNDESASPEEPLPEDVRDGPADSDRFSPMFINEASLTNEELHNPLSSPVSTERSLSLTPLSTPTRSRHEGDTPSTSGTAHGDGPSEFASRRFASPSPTPSEHGSDGVRSGLHAQHSEPDITELSETRPASPQSSALTESFYEFSAPSSPSSSGQSVVFISADGIPDYVRENRAYLVATSVASPSSGRSPVLLPSSSSLESLELLQEPPNDTAQSVDSAGSTTSTVTYRHHCRICQRDPCEDMTATICGHIFCKKCVTQAVVAKSECPVCHSATLLYCLFKLDLSV